jgi:hypothetical protein
LGDLDLSSENARSVVGKTARKISVGSVYPLSGVMKPKLLSWLKNLTVPLAMKCDDITSFRRGFGPTRRLMSQ